MDQNTSNCETTLLSNGSKLYWQFNCDSIWLTLETPKNKKVIVDRLDIELYGYLYRLGFHLAKEYDKYLLFRSGCPANGACNFILVDKQTGKEIKEYGELIYDHENDTFYDFVLYFNTRRNALTLEYIGTKKKHTIPINANHFAASTIAEYQFEKITRNNNLLTLEYFYGDKEQNKIIIDLSKLK